MKYYLVDGGFNWADEMNLNGWDILSEEELNQLKIDFAPNGKYGNLSVEKYIGSNEEQEFSAARLFADLSGARLLTNEEYNTLKKFFGTHYGFTNYKYIMKHLGLN